MFKKNAVARTVLATLAACTGLTVLMGADCSPTDIASLTNIIDAVTAVTPTGTGGSSTPTSTSTPTSAATPAAAARPITARIAASKSSNIQLNENITFTAANVAGGTPPYTYFWIMDHDTAFTPAGPSFTRTIDGSAPTRSVTLVVRDSTNTDSDYITLAVTLGQPAAAASPTVCSDMSGVWNATFGDMTLTQTGSNVTGSYNYFGCIGTISGALAPDPDTRNSCPRCLRWSGTWSETGANCSGQSGTFSFSVEPDLSSFSGRWTKNPNTHPQPDLWSGYHRTCRDGSVASPRP